ncbi:MAG: hypothetical protein Q4G04_01675 [bacterium]|nr:hypothetical protein [bacterium]
MKNELTTTINMLSIDGQREIKGYQVYELTLPEEDKNTYLVIQPTESIVGQNIEDHNAQDDLSYIYKVIESVSDEVNPEKIVGYIVEPAPVDKMQADCKLKLVESEVVTIQAIVKRQKTK